MDRHTHTLMEKGNTWTDRHTHTLTEMQDMDKQNFGPKDPLILVQH